MKKLKEYESFHIISAILILSIVIGFRFIIQNSWKSYLFQALFFSLIIIGTNILSKKIIANALDSDVEHSLWEISRLSLKEKKKFKNELPAGILFPLVFSLITLGKIKIMTLLTYEAKALKRRAAKRHGHYSFTELTEWHNALIGTAGILSLLAISVISYFIPANIELLARMSIFYAFFNMLPLSKLDGTQIYFGSKTLYTILASLTIIFTLYALIIV